MGMKGLNVHVLQSNHVLWLTIYQIPSQAARLLSANIGYPNPQTIKRAAARIYAGNCVNTGIPIIDISDE